MNERVIHSCALHRQQASAMRLKYLGLIIVHLVISTRAEVKVDLGGLWALTNANRSKSKCSSTLLNGGQVDEVTCASPSISGTLV